MAIQTHINDVVVNAQAGSIQALFNSAKIHIYNGTQPATAATAISGNTLGVILTMNATAFGSPASGVLTANAITNGTATTGITPTWARITTSVGTPETSPPVGVLMDCSCGASDANLIVGAFAAGTSVSASVFTVDIRNTTSGL